MLKVRVGSELTSPRKTSVTTWRLASGSRPLSRRMLSRPHPRPPVLSCLLTRPSRTRRAEEAQADPLEACRAVEGVDRCKQTPMLVSVQCPYVYLPSSPTSHPPQPSYSPSLPP
uniref:Uncharacterized protein n=1 Tax=Cacopsylla melanoneura TaxID=428564 RepID=A0A8D8XSZ8_9HEMI